MKLTWFAGSVFRIQIGGAIVVTDAHAAPAGIDPNELTGAADSVVTLDDAALPAFDPSTWRPRKAPRLIDDAPDNPVLDIYRTGARGLFVAALGEAPLVLCAADAPPEWGRWADGAVIALCGAPDACAAAGAGALAVARPRLIALAVEGEVDAAFSAIAPQLGDAGLLVLEPALAVEV